MLLDAEYSRKSSFEGGVGPIALLGVYTVGKILKTTSAYTAFDALIGQHVQLAPFLCLILSIAAAFFVFSQKAWTYRLSVQQWLTVAAYSVVVLIYLIAWTVVLEYYGPLKTFMVLDYSEVTIVIILETFLHKKTLSREKIGSFVAIGLAYLIVMFSSPFVTIADANGMHIWDHTEPPMLISSACLVLCILLGVAKKRLAHRLTRSEPLRRNHKLTTAFSTSIAALILSPSLLFARFDEAFIASSAALAQHWSFLHLVVVILEIAVLFLVVDFFIESNMRRRVASSLLAKVGLITQFIVCFIYEWIFQMEGSFSFFTWLAFACLVGGQHFMLTTAGKSGHADDLNPSSEDSLLPMAGHSEPSSSASFSTSSRHGGKQGGNAISNLFSSFFELFDQQSASPVNSGTGNSSSYAYEYDSGAADELPGLDRPQLIRRFSKSAHQILREIWSSPTSRNIFLFMLVNFAFMFVELAYGWWTNSLGLITDAFHMLFDCTALGIGLYAEVVSRWPPSKGFTFGFGRVEVLAGYLNGVFLGFISFGIFAHSLVRMWSPPDVATDRLLLISCLGLGVNLIGIFAFHDFDLLELMGLKTKKEHDHSHGHDNCDHSHGGHSHGGHSHGGHGHSHGHSHGHHGHDCAHHSDNLTGIFLHIVADALGSISVIISSLLIWQFGWHRADAVGSLVVSILIFASVIPLLKSSVKVLMQTTPESFANKVPLLIDSIVTTPGVLGCSSRHFWTLTPSELIGSVHLKVSPEYQREHILSSIKHTFKEAGVTEITVQLEAEHSNGRRHS